MNESLLTLTEIEKMLQALPVEDGNEVYACLAQIDKLIRRYGDNARLAVTVRHARLQLEAEQELLDESTSY